MRSYLEAMRLGRWPRSLAVLSGVAAYAFLHRSEPARATLLWFAQRSLIAFVFTWAVSTANYIINEIADAPFDAHHPTKRHRPLVEGRVRKGPLLLAGILIAAFSLTLSFLFFHLPFFLSLLALFAAGIAYNIKPIRTKDIPFLDSVSESANNPIRFLIGWFALAPAGILPPLSILLSWWFFGNYLMISKRLSEFRLLRGKAEHYRASLGRYSTASLLFGIVLSAGLFFVGYFFFALAFKLQSFIYLSPLLLAYFVLIFWKTLKEKEAMEEPESLLRNAGFSVFTLLLLFAYSLTYFLDTLGR